MILMNPPKIFAYFLKFLVKVVEVYMDGFYKEAKYSYGKDN